MGPFELMDLIGLDVNFEVTNQVGEKALIGTPGFKPNRGSSKIWLIQESLEENPGGGFYDYSPGKTPKTENLPECQPPDSIIIEGTEQLPESLLKMLKAENASIKSTLGSGKIRLPEGGKFWCLKRKKL
ncbi:MAG: hypothetical protein Ct9H300mP28_26490 [Pseudomonadota bacterium]|nr:MAG: hypothetical protein Ct9H300mP28_26490 [Pseudomonadota bacterium]